MTTLSDLVNDVLLTVEGYGLDQPRTAYLTQPATVSDLTLYVDSTDDISEGIVEIGNELIYVRSVSDDFALAVAPDGRGYRGTTAEAHAVDARVTVNPVLPKSLVQRKVNETIVGLWPTVWGEATTTVTPSSVSVGYSLPADVEEVVSVDHEVDDISKTWGPVRRWRFESSADTTDFPTGKALFVFQDTGLTDDIRVRYRKQPTELANDSDDLTVVAGLRSSARAVIVAGTVWRLVSSMDMSRLKANAVPSDLMDEGNPVGNATQIAGYLRRVYERELLDEQQRLQVSTPPIIHYTG